MNAEITEVKHKFLDRQTIKYIAVATMFISHSVAVFPLPWNMAGSTIMSIGYFTGFVMLYFLVEG